jgi:ABC-2 type transport system ATP-binding protein
VTAHDYPKDGLFSGGRLPYIDCMIENAVDISGLRKTYRASGKSPEKVALDGIDLRIPRGSIFGLLGPNGAGKSTLINILAGLVVKSAGTVKIWDIDIDAQSRHAKSAIGVVPQEINFDPFFSPLRLLDIQAGLYGVPSAERRSLELLDLVGLKDKANAYTRSLSGGMKRRLMMAKALVHNPPVLVLDEPTAGVDVELRQMMWEKVRWLNKERGVTVLLTTHYLEEAEQLCDRIAIINHGRIIANEATGSLLARIDSKEMTIHLDRDVVRVPPQLSGQTVDISGLRTLTVQYRPRDISAGAIIDAVRAEGLGIADISTRQSRLEDVFLKLTRKAA